MSIGSLGIVGSLAGTALAQKSAEVDKTQRDAADAARKTEATSRAESAEGIGQTEEESQAGERDADGRRLWERPAKKPAEDENGVTFHIALPAVPKEDLKLTLHESNLKIEARRADAIPATWKTHRDNGAAGRYGLDIRLTRRFDGTKATATLDSGVLTLRVPIREEAKPRQIEVN